MRQISYFESLPLNYKGACYHSFTEHHLGTSENPSLTWSVSISPSLSIVLQFFFFLCVCCWLLNLLWIWMGFGEWKKDPFLKQNLLYLMMLENQQWATRYTRNRDDTCTIQKRKDLIESNGVVSAKYPPKVKLELLTTLEC